MKTLLRMLQIGIHQVIAHPLLFLVPPLGRRLHSLTCYNHGDVVANGECIHCGEPASKEGMP